MKPINRKIYLIAVIAIVLVLALSLVFLSGCAGCGKVKAKTPIRIGWNTTWATQGQLIEVLKNTNILELNSLKGEFKGFTYGGPLGEAALADQVDVMFSADQPAINLIARGAKWKIVGRSIVFRDAILVPVGSTAKTIADLKGKKIAVPFGSGAHRITIEAIEEAGLKVDKDVQLVNLDVTEINNMIKAGVENTDSQLWKGGIAAAANWDPNIAIFESNNEARVLFPRILLGVTTMSEKFIQQNPKGAANFLAALKQAFLYYATNQQQANEWFVKEGQIAYDTSILDTSASFDSNIKAKALNDIDLNLTEKDIAVLQKSSDYAYTANLIKTHPMANDFVDLSHLKKADDTINKGKFDPSKVKVIQP